MEATEGSVARPQLRHFLCDLRGRTRVLVYLEDRILKRTIENRFFKLAIDVGLRCKLVLTCGTNLPRRGGQGWKGKQDRGSL
jgi:hypothetical protein